MIIAFPNGFGDQILEILNQRTNDPDLIQKTIHILQKSGGIEFTENVAEKLINESKEMRF